MLDAEDDAKVEGDDGAGALLGGIDGLKLGGVIGAPSRRGACRSPAGRGPGTGGRVGRSIGNMAASWWCGWRGAAAGAPLENLDDVGKPEHVGPGGLAEGGVPLGWVGVLGDDGAELVAEEGGEGTDGRLVESGDLVQDRGSEGTRLLAPTVSQRERGSGAGEPGRGRAGRAGRRWAQGRRSRERTRRRRSSRSRRMGGEEGSPARSKAHVERRQEGSEGVWPGRWRRSRRTCEWQAHPQGACRRRGRWRRGPRPGNSRAGVGGPACSRRVRWAGSGPCPAAAQSRQARPHGRNSRERVVHQRS